MAKCVLASAAPGAMQSSIMETDASIHDGRTDTKTTNWSQPIHTTPIKDSDFNPNPTLFAHNRLFM